jgi:hypothetical protein
VSERPTPEQIAKIRAHLDDGWDLSNKQGRELLAELDAEDDLDALRVRVSERMTPERLAEIRRQQPTFHPRHGNSHCPLCAINELLAELDAVTRERAKRTHHNRRCDERTDPDST